MAKNYEHPHDEVNITDSTYLKTITAANEGKVLFQAYTSSMGDDSKIITWDDYDKFIEENGEPSMPITGQAMYNAALWLKNGGVLKGLRITASDATRANSVVMMHMKIVDEQSVDAAKNPLYIDRITGALTTISSGNAPAMNKRAKVKITLETLTKPASNKVDMDTILRSLYSIDTEGYHIPLYAVVCKGKGAYGKMYRHRLTLNTSRDKSTTYRNYYFEVMKNTTGSGLQTIENSPLNTAIVPSAMYGTKSQYIVDVIGRQQQYPINVYMVDGFWNEITELLLPVVQQQYPEMTAEKLDILLFYDENLVQYKYVDVLDNSVDLTALEGYSLKNGSDGQFATSNKTREDAITERLLDLFDGTLDSSINDVKEHIIDLALDACYPLEVKKAMVAWRNKRGDFPLILDAGIIYKLSDLKTFLSEDMVLDDYNIKLTAETFDTQDPYSGKIIRVSMNYLIAAEYPKFIKANSGVDKPFAGVDIPLNDYIIEGSIRPIISDELDKSAIYKLRGNYIERENGVYTFGCDVSTQLEESEMVYFNNTMQLHEMMKDFKSLGSIVRFKNMSTSEDLQTLNKLGTAKMDSYIGTKIKAGSFQMASDSTDPRQKTCRSKIKVGFNTFILDNVFDFSIERM